MAVNDCTAAYQGVRGLDWRAILEQNEAFAPEPDLVALLDLDPDLSLARIGERGLINPYRQAYFGEHRPASTLVEVSALVDPRLSVEIEAVAVLPD